MKAVVRNIKNALPAGADTLAVIEAVAEKFFCRHDFPFDIFISSETERLAIMETLDGVDDAKNAGPEVLGCIYESLIEPDANNSKQGRRRKGGIFYTPGYITRFLVKSAIRESRSGKNNTPPKIIDPACGSGAFLLAAFHELKSQFPKISSSEIATRYLSGVDSDEKAVHVARISLALAAGLKKSGYLKLTENIYCGDSLREFTKAPGSFDIVIGNPPYRNVKRGIDSSTRDFIRNNFKTATGQTDLSVAFIELAMVHLLKDRGALGYILPNPILLAENYKPVRKLLLENNVIAFGPARKVFDDPQVEASLIIARRGRPGSNLKILSVNEKKVRKSGAVAKKLIERLPSNVFTHTADNNFLTGILDRLDSGHLVRLGDLVDFTRGIECGKRDSRILPGIKKIKGTLPLVTGNNVHEYSVKPKHRLVLPKDKSEREKFLKDESLWRGPGRLMIRRVSPAPVAAVCESVCVALNTLYVVRGDDFDHHSLCTLINSAIFSKIFNQMYAFDDKLFPYLRISQLRNIPVPIKTLNNTNLSKWSRALHGKNSGAPILKAKIDKAITKMYGFPVD